MVIKKIAIIGGDERFGVCAGLFSDLGYECAVYGLEKSMLLSGATKCNCVKDAVFASDAIILPIPTSKDGINIYAPCSDKTIPISEILNHASDSCVFFIGEDEAEFKKRYDMAKEAAVVSYTKSKTFATLGSVPTAECAVALAIYHSRKTCCNSSFLVSGCGNIGKRLSLLLKNMGACVSVSARKNEDLAWISSHGMRALKTQELSDCNAVFDVIFNTIPYPVFTESVLKNLKGSPIFIELASKPYGCDFKPAKTCCLALFFFQHILHRKKHFSTYYGFVC